MNGDKEWVEPHTRRNANGTISNVKGHYRTTNKSGHGQPYKPIYFEPSHSRTYYTKPQEKKGSEIEKFYLYLFWLSIVFTGMFFLVLPMATLILVSIALVVFVIKYNVGKSNIVFGSAISLLVFCIFILISMLV